jgi:hypothetical protein
MEKSELLEIFNAEFQTRRLDDLRKSNEIYKF